MDLTDGWLTDWGQEGGRFKEWIRHLHLDAINHGWVSAICNEPDRWYRRVKHVVSWMPVLWEDYDFDKVYIWILMREKLRRMQQFQHKEKLVSDWKKIADEMRVAELVLTRLIEDKYVEEDWDLHFEKYGGLEKRRIARDDGSVVYPSTHGTPEGDDVRRIGQREWACKRADMEYLGAYLSKRIWAWWS